MRQRWRKLLSDPWFLAALAVAIAVVVMALLAPLVAPYDRPSSFQRASQRMVNPYRQAGSSFWVRTYWGGICSRELCGEPAHLLLLEFLRMGWLWP
jgi:ABC-type antimicrobial peptide transport system permease subunit